MKKQQKGYIGSVVMVVLLILTAMGSAWGDATYSSDGNLHLYMVDVPGSGTYDAYLKATGGTGMEFYLASAQEVAPGPGIVASFNAETGILSIPKLAMNGVSNSTKYVDVDLELIPGSDPMRFKVKGVYGLQVGVDDRGPMGPRGLKGDTGATGATGATGLAGPMGAIGPPGPQGPIGLPGPTGAAGATGASGPQGIQGTSGPQGPTGAQGPIGLTGPVGPQGPAGPTGATGSQGVPGVINSAGISTVTCNGVFNCYCPAGMDILNVSVACPDNAYAGPGNCWSAVYSLAHSMVYSKSEGYSAGFAAVACSSEIVDCILAHSHSYVVPQYIKIHCF